MENVFAGILIFIFSVFAILNLIGELGLLVDAIKRNRNRRRIKEVERESRESKISLYKAYQPPPGKYGPYKWMIKKRKWWIFWKMVYDPNKKVRSVNDHTQFPIPYYFDTKREADDFIINELIGKTDYREQRLKQLLG